MRLIVALLVLVIAVGCGGPEPTATLMAACKPTQPNGDTPPGRDPSPRFHGNGLLFTTGLPDGGEILADPRSVAADGSIDVKFAWWRAPGVGAAGDLQITGHEITTGATITASIPDGYGQPFQSTGIIFPAEGCYEITVKSGDALLIFVTKVTKIAAPSPNS